MKIVGRMVFVSQSVSVSVQAFSLIASERPVRSGPGCHRSTHRSAGTMMAPVRGRPAARGTWHVPPREGLQKVVDAPTGQTGGATNVILTGHTHTTQLKIRWGCMKKGAGVHGARAVHVQVFSTHHFLAALRGTRVAPPIPNSQVTRMPYQLKILWGCHCGGVQVARARGEKPFSPGVLRFKEILS